MFFTNINFFKFIILCILKNNLILYIINMYTYVNFLPNYMTMFNTATSVTNNDILQECKTAFSSFTYDNVKLEGYCKQIFNYLSELYKLSPKEKTEGCHFLNYWMNNNVKNILVSGKLLDFLVKILENTHIKGKFDENLCKDSIKEIDISVLNNVKDLIKLYENLYFSILKEDENTPVNCAQLGKCYELYKTKVKLCRGDTNEDFCYELEKFIINYNKNMRNEVSCTGIPNRLPYIYGISSATDTLITSSVTLAVTSVLFMIYKVEHFHNIKIKLLYRKDNIQKKLFFSYNHEFFKCVFSLS
ncbi:hypothetical protein PVBG_05430 [Plasmodium vivax Brazil I]|uniref:Variable surface protein n=1 Tax=Plasmodium vivax (strain Brazil I) TaxID=1033975 RepID=A0A0J9T1K8_PLAV1|nr:hypothetical protein PVBG_05430 [Plasmodium vivax Brazil I]